MISQIFKDARAALPEVARLSDAKRNEILLALADAIAPEAEAILSANRMDCERMEEGNHFCIFERQKKHLKNSTRSTLSLFADERY